MDNIIKVFIDPFCRVFYSTFYIKGLIQEFGQDNVSFSSKYFTDLKRDDKPYFNYFAFVLLLPNKRLVKVVVDYRDSYYISDSSYDWADIFAKININEELTESRFKDKLMSVAPGFGISLWGYLEFVSLLFKNFNLIRSQPGFSRKFYLKDYKDQIKREKLEYYLSPKTKNGSISKNKPYVFFISSLWNHQNCVESTNLWRKEFIEACLRAECEFEGGFKARKDHPQYEEFKRICFLKGYSIREYIDKTKESAIVFNTPAVHQCHGWKLGEFLAMGKAIISTPLVNKLPEDLVHGVNIHFVSSVQEIEPAVNFLLKNPSYRKKLEKGAFEYYQKFVDPQQVIKSIIKKS